MINKKIVSIYSKRKLSVISDLINNKLHEIQAIKTKKHLNESEIYKFLEALS
jgi:hypothetical protein